MELKILIISPYNALCQENNKNGFDGITYDKLFGLVVNVKEVPNFNKVDISEYDYIVFDEIMLYNVKQLMNIMYFIDLNPNKRIIATGDSDQNTPFMNILNQYEYTMNQYLYNCVCMMCPNQLTLCINKRLKKEEEKSIITQLKNELFDKNSIPIDVLQKYFKVITNIKELQTTNNMCYYKYRKKYINKYVFNKLVVKKNIITVRFLYTQMKRRKKEMGFYLRKSILLKVKISYIILVWF